MDYLLMDLSIIDISQLVGSVTDQVKLDNSFSFTHKYNGMLHERLHKQMLYTRSVTAIITLKLTPSICRPSFLYMVNPH